MDEVRETYNFYYDIVTVYIYRERYTEIIVTIYIWLVTIRVIAKNHDIFIYINTRIYTHTNICLYKDPK